MPVPSGGAHTEREHVAPSTTKAAPAASPPAHVQAKLTVGSTNDPLERQAEQVADEVMVSIQRRFDVGSPPNRIPSSMPGRIRRKADAVGAEGGPVGGDLEREIAAARRSGRALDEPLRRSMESAMGADFSGIRVHVGEQSDQLNRQVSARAFSYGNDVFVRRSDYQPHSAAGQHLLAHELAHTVQQGAAPRLDRSFDDGEFVEDGVLRRTAVSSLIQRDDDEDEAEDEEDEGIADIASLIGDNGPGELEKQFDAAVSTTKEAIDDLDGLSLGTTGGVTNAKQQLAVAQAAMKEVERLEQLIDK